MELYDVEHSGNCYKIRLFAALTGLTIDLKTVDFPAGEHKTEAFAALSPMQQVPVLADGDTVIWDSQAILIYLARQHNLIDWWPDDAAGQAHIAAWLCVANNEALRGPATARRLTIRGGPGDLQAAYAMTDNLLPRLERYLSAHSWLALGRPTIADIAMFPYLALAHEGKIDLTPYPVLRAWLTRIAQQPGFITMPGISSTFL